MRTPGVNSGLAFIQGRRLIEEIQYVSMLIYHQLFYHQFLIPVVDQYSCKSNHECTLLVLTFSVKIGHQSILHLNEHPYCTYVSDIKESQWHFVSQICAMTIVPEL